MFALPGLDEFALVVGVVWRFGRVFWCGGVGVGLFLGEFILDEADDGGLVLGVEVVVPEKLLDR